MEPARDITQPLRAIVLLPDGDVHEARLAAAFHRQCACTQVCVIPTRAAQTPRAELSLALLAALLRDAGRTVTQLALPYGDVLQALRSMQRPGDVFVCLGEHLVPDSAGPRAVLRPIDSYLRALRTNVVVLHGCMQPGNPREAMRHRLRGVLGPVVVLLMSILQLYVIGQSLDPDGPGVRAFLLVTSAIELICMGTLFS